MSVLLHYAHEELRGEVAGVPVQRRAHRTVAVGGAAGGDQPDQPLRGGGDAIAVGGAGDCAGDSGAGALCDGGDERTGVQAVRRAGGAAGELLDRLMIKFSFQYLELKRLGWFDRFFDNVRKMRSAGRRYRWS